MNITIIGAGNMGSGFVKQLTRAGHQVVVTARDQAKAQALADANPGATARPASSAAAHADIIVLATGFGDAIGALDSLGKLDGKIVIDITNPLTADYMGLTIGHSTSAAEEIAKAHPEVIVVKAFNTVFAQVLAAGADFGQGQTVPVLVASDHAEAKQRVQALAESIGFASIDAGGLRNARYLEPLGGLNIYFAYGAGQGTDIAPTWLHKA
ncbi:MAG: oxidoreductase, coenzyme F420-dependent [Proteobacteria bacterium]|nr:oxidoreductase, coenzyme F420-dependent [Pseudomonadota bacterium]